MRNRELEVQAERKGQTVLHDEVDRILNSVIDLTSQIGSPDKETQEQIKYVIKIMILEVDVEILWTKMICEVAELIGLVNHCECMIRGALSMVKDTSFLFIIGSKFSYVIFFSQGKGNTVSEDIPIVKKLTPLKISRDWIEYVIDNCQGIYDSSIILGFNE
jgi:hypothetical protein